MRIAELLAPKVSVVSRRDDVWEHIVPVGAQVLHLSRGLLQISAVAGGKCAEGQRCAYGFMAGIRAVEQRQCRSL
jgi:hypothetical protein